MEPQRDESSNDDPDNNPFDDLVDDVLDHKNDWVMEYTKDDLFIEEFQEDQQLTAVQAKARKGVLDAIAMLPAEKRAAYEFAVESNPFVVEIETPIERFLLVKNYNFWDAAVQLCDFWTLRRNTMGEERYWLPLKIAPNSPEESALAPTVIESIQTGVMAILPPDEKGRPVVVWDRQLQGDIVIGEDEFAQLTFYILHIMCGMDLALSNGYVQICLPDYESPEASPGSPTLPSRCVTNMGKAALMVSDPAVPVKNQAFYQIHIRSLGKCNHEAGSDHRNYHFFVSWLHQTLANQMPVWNFLRSKLNIHDVSCVEEAHGILCKSGMSPQQHFPKRLGGTHDAQFWVRRRVELERELYEDDELLGITLDMATGRDSIPTTESFSNLSGPLPQEARRTQLEPVQTPVQTPMAAVFGFTETLTATQMKTTNSTLATKNHTTEPPEESDNLERIADEPVVVAPSADACAAASSSSMIHNCSKASISPDRSTAASHSDSAVTHANKKIKKKDGSLVVKNSKRDPADDAQPDNAPEAHNLEGMVAESLAPTDGSGKSANPSPGIRENYITSSRGCVSVSDEARNNDSDLNSKDDKEEILVNNAPTQKRRRGRPPGPRGPYEPRKIDLLDTLISETEAHAKSEQVRMEGLRQQNELLRAQLVRAHYVTAQYQRDYQNITIYLEQVFNMAADILSKENGARSCSPATPIPSVVEEVLEHLLLFQGRNPVTRQLGLTQHEENINALDAPQVQQAMQGLTELLQIVTRELIGEGLEEEEMFEDCLSEGQDGDDGSMVEMDDRIPSLQRQVLTLEQTNKRLKHEQEFLEASHVCAKQTAAEFEEYKRQNLASFAQSMATTVAALLSKKSTNQEGGNEQSNQLPDSSSPHWQVMADRVLSKLLWWRAQSIPPKVTLETLSLAVSM